MISLSSNVSGSIEDVVLNSNSSLDNIVAGDLKLET